MAHATASLAGGRRAYTGRGRRAVGHRGAVIGDVVAPAGERGLGCPESLAARSPLQDGAPWPAGAECHFSNQCRSGETSRRITGEYFDNGPAYLHACAHADLRKSRKEEREFGTCKVPVYRNGCVKKMNIMEEERRVAHKAPKTASPRRAGGRTRARSIPRWAYVLFAVLALLVLIRSFQRGVGTSGTAQAPVRPVTVAKVVAKDVPLYLDEIGTCAAYETVQVQAQVSGVIIGRHFQDGSDLKKGDSLFTIDPRPFQAALDQAKAQAELDQVTLKRQEDLRAKGVNAPQDYDIAVANEQKSQAAAEAAQVNLDYCYIKS